MRATWVLTVASLTTRVAAISALDEAPRHQVQHFEFPFGERGDFGWPVVRCRVAGELLDHPAGDGRVEQGRAGSHDPDRLHQVLGRVRS